MLTAFNVTRAYSLHHAVNYSINTLMTEKFWFQESKKRKWLQEEKLDKSDLKMKPASILSFQLHEKLHLLATFYTFQRQKQRYFFCNTQQWSHNHKWVLCKWEQQMVWHFWEVVVDTFNRHVRNFAATFEQSSRGNEAMPLANLVLSERTAHILFDKKAQIWKISRQNCLVFKSIATLEYSITLHSFNHFTNEL